MYFFVLFSLLGKNETIIWYKDELIWVYSGNTLFTADSLDVFTYSGKCSKQGLPWNPILQWSGDRVMSKEYKETDAIACRDSVMATYAIRPVISQPESVAARGHFSLQDHLLPCHLPPGERTTVCEWVHFLSHHSGDVWHSLHLILSRCFMVYSRRRLTLCQQAGAPPSFNGHLLVAAPPSITERISSEAEVLIS